LDRRRAETFESRADFESAIGGGGKKAQHAWGPRRRKGGNSLPEDEVKGKRIDWKEESSKRKGLNRRLFFRS